MTLSASSRIRGLAAILALLALLALPLSSFAQSATAVSGQAFGVSATGTVEIEPTPLVVLPATGGDLSDEVASIDEAGVTTGVLQVSTSGTLDPAASTSTATVNDLAVSLDVLGTGTGTDIVSATTLQATSDSMCNEDGTAESNGDSIIEGLTVLGEEVTVSGEPNQTETVDLPGGAGTVEVVINEQIEQTDENTSALIVNALRVTVTVGAEEQTIVVASAASDVEACTAVLGGGEDPEDDQQDDQQGGAGDGDGTDDGAGGGDLPKTGGAPVGQAVPFAGTAAAALAGAGVYVVRRRA